MIFTLLTAALLGGACHALYLQASGYLLEVLRFNQTVVAAHVAAEIDGNQHERVRNAGDPDYMQIREALRRSLRVNPKLRDVYTLKPSSGYTWQFMVDALASTDPVYSAPGTAYDTRQDGQFAEGERNPTASRGLYHDEYGVWLSGYAPIRSAQGRIVGVVGADMSAQEFENQLGRLRSLTWIIFLAGVSVSVLGGWFFARQASQPIQRLEAHSDAAELRNRHLEQLNEELLELAHLKDEFISNVSHELRTPLTVINGAVTLMQQTKFGPLTEAQRRFAGMISAHTQRLTRLINDILDFAKIEHGSMTYVMEDVDLGLFARAVAETFDPACQEAGITLILPASPQPAWVVADRDRLSQVLTNLLSNALKFTPCAGQIAVSVEAAEETVTLAVQDTGIGMPPEALDLIFSKFYQVDGSHTRNAGGTGLGLAITRAIVESGLGGRILVASEPGKGTTFSVLLPRRRDDSSPSAPQETAAGPVA